MTFNAQGKPQLATGTKKDANNVDVATLTVGLNKFNEDTGAVKRTDTYEIDAAKLTNERDRLLAQAQIITQFLADLPKL